LIVLFLLYFFFFFQAEDGIRDFHVTGVQTCALPILYCQWKNMMFKFKASSMNRVAINWMMSNYKHEFFLIPFQNSTQLIIKLLFGFYAAAASASNGPETTLHPPLCI